jgi:hypothetical protein
MVSNSLSPVISDGSPSFVGAAAFIEQPQSIQLNGPMLNLVNCSLSDDSFSVLLRHVVASASRQSVVHIDASSNPNMGDRAAHSLARALPLLPRLHTIDLSRTAVGDSGVAALCAAIVAGHREAARVLRGDFSDACAGDSGATRARHVDGTSLSSTTLFGPPSGVRSLRIDRTQITDVVLRDLALLVMSAETTDPDVGSGVENDFGFDQGESPLGSHATVIGLEELAMRDTDALTPKSLAAFVSGPLNRSVTCLRCLLPRQAGLAVLNAATAIGRRNNNRRFPGADARATASSPRSARQAQSEFIRAKQAASARSAAATAAPDGPLIVSSLGPLTRRRAPPTRALGVPTTARGDYLEYSEAADALQLHNSRHFIQSGNSPRNGGRASDTVLVSSSPRVADRTRRPPPTLAQWGDAAIAASLVSLELLDARRAAARDAVAERNYLTAVRMGAVRRSDDAFVFTTPVLPSLTRARRPG